MGAHNVVAKDLAIFEKPCQILQQVRITFWHATHLGHSFGRPNVLYLCPIYATVIEQQRTELCEAHPQNLQTGVPSATIDTFLADDGARGQYDCG